MSGRSSSGVPPVQLLHSSRMNTRSAGRLDANPDLPQLAECAARGTLHGCKPALDLARAQAPYVTRSSTAIEDAMLHLKAPPIIDLDNSVVA